MTVPTRSLVRVEAGERVDLGDFEHLIRASVSGDASILSAVVAQACVLDGFDASVISTTSLRVLRNSGAFIAPFLAPGGNLYGTGSLVASLINDQDGASAVDLGLGALAHDWYHIYVRTSLVNSTNGERIFWNPTTSVEFPQNIDTRWALTWSVTAALTTAGVPSDAARVATVNWDGTLTAAKLYAAKAMLFEGAAVTGGSVATVPAPVSFDRDHITNFDRADNRDAVGSSNLAEFARAVLRRIEEIQDPHNGRWWAEPPYALSLQATRSHTLSIGHPGLPGNFTATATGGSGGWDITAALLAAVAAATAIALPCTIVLHPGSYYVSAIRTFNSAVRLTGLGAEQVQIEFSASGRIDFRGAVESAIDNIRLLAASGDADVIRTEQQTVFAVERVRYSYTAKTIPQALWMAVDASAGGGSVAIDSCVITGELKCLLAVAALSIRNSRFESVLVTAAVDTSFFTSRIDNLVLASVTGPAQMLDCSFGRLAVTGAAAADFVVERCLLEGTTTAAAVADTPRASINLTGAAGGTVARFVLRDVVVESGDAAKTLNGIYLFDTLATFTDAILDGIDAYAGHSGETTGFGSGWAVLATSTSQRHVLRRVRVRDVGQHGIAWPGRAEQIEVRKQRRGSFAVGDMLNGMTEIVGLVVVVEYNPALPPTGVPAFVMRDVVDVTDATIDIPDSRTTYAIDWTSAASTVVARWRNVVIGNAATGAVGIYIDTSVIRGLEADGLRLRTADAKVTCRDSGDDYERIVLLGVVADGDLQVLTNSLQNKTVRGARCEIRRAQVYGETTVFGLWSSVEAVDSEFGEGLTVLRTAKNYVGGTCRVARSTLYRTGRTGTSLANNFPNVTGTYGALSVFGVTGDDSHDFRDVIVEDCDFRAQLDNGLYSSPTVLGAVRIDAAHRAIIRDCRAYMEVVADTGDYIPFRLQGRSMLFARNDVRLIAAGTGWDVAEVVRMVSDGPATGEFPTLLGQEFSVDGNTFDLAFQGALLNETRLEEALVKVGTNLPLSTATRLIRFVGNTVNFPAKVATVRLVAEVVGQEFPAASKDAGVASGNVIFERGLGTFPTVMATHLDVARSDASTVTWIEAGNSVSSSV